MSIRFSPGMSTPNIRGIIKMGKELALTLFVARIGAYHTNDAFALYYLAMFAEPFN